MTAVLTGLASGVAIAAGTPLVILAVELAAGLSGRRQRVGTQDFGTCAVLVPAHDEASGIGAMLADLRNIAPAGTPILVVADNCSDATAQIARDSGVLVTERQDAGRKGKGYALSHGRDTISQWDEQPDVVVVLDADCHLTPGSLEALTSAALSAQAPVQAINLISPDLSAAPMVQISGFAFVVKNLFRSRGMQRLGGAALLTGTGMAFPWHHFANANLANGALAEDLALGLEFTRAGSPPRLVEDAEVGSNPAGMDVALQQRTRWEHGFLDTVRTQALPLLTRGFRNGSRAEILLALHLMVPPLALTVMLAGVALAITAILAALGASVFPLVLLAAVFATAIALLSAAWAIGGRRHLSPGALLRAPLYVLWKLPIYLGFLRRPETEWKRTPRSENHRGDTLP